MSQKVDSFVTERRPPLKEVATLIYQIYVYVQFSIFSTTKLRSKSVIIFRQGKVFLLIFLIPGSLYEVKPEIKKKSKNQKMITGL